MSIPRCPNCSFKLVLLPSRSKYKCAKCGRVFPQKGIEDKTFKQWNIKQREIDKHNLKLEKKVKERPKLSEEEKEIRRTEYLLKNRDKIRAKEREKYWKNHKKELERCRIYRENNREKRSLTSKRWIKENKEYHKQWLKSYLEKNKEKDKLKKRLGYWRAKQRTLALKERRNIEEKAYNTDIFTSPPTSVHYHLLII